MGVLNDFYPAVSGVFVYENEVDKHTENMADAHTAGFKEGMYKIESMPTHTRVRTSGAAHLPIGEGSDGIYSGKCVTNFSQGDLTETTRSLDFAIIGNAFFRVIDADGEIRVTRGGNFHLDDEGYLVDANGKRVMGADGAAIFCGTDQVVLNEDGTLVDKDDQPLGKIGVWAVENLDELERTDGNCFKAKATALIELPSGDVELHQFALEQSNVDFTSNTLSLAKNFQGLAIYTNITKVIKKLGEKTEEIISQR